MTEPPSGVPAVLRRHRTPASDLDELAVGCLAPGTARRLWTVERSRRMLMLRAVVDTARQSAARVPLHPDAAMKLLLRVEKARPDVVADLLEHPGTGTWAVRILERLHSGERSNGAGGILPLWAELGYLQCLAAAGALRSGTEGTIRLPVYGTVVILPTLGRVRLPDPAVGRTRAEQPDLATLRVGGAADGSAQLVLGDRTVNLPADLRRRHGVWQPLHRIGWSPAPQDPPLTLEDGDPYGDFSDNSSWASAAPLTGPETEHWRRLLAEAGGILHDRHPRAAQLVSHALRVLVPLPATPRFRTASASYNEAVGSALMSLPQDAAELAATLVHEARHSVLNGLLHQLPLCEDGSALLYAPWRGDPRPLSGVLHGVYAFAGVADYWRVERRALSGPPADLAHFEFAVWRAAVDEALGTLHASRELTDFGRRFVETMAEEVHAWAEEPVPARQRSLARAETADLRAVWRARHMRPDPGQARLVADAWLSGADPGKLPPVDTRLRPDARAGSPVARSELRRVLLAEPGALAERARGGHGTPVRPAALAAADVNLLRGAADRAARGYAAVLAARPGSPSAWAGLGLALRELGEPTAAHALLHRPELVRAVHERLAASPGQPPDPVTTADWIGRIPAVREET